MSLSLPRWPPSEAFVTEDDDGPCPDDRDGGEGATIVVVGTGGRAAADRVARQIEELAARGVRHVVVEVLVHDVLVGSRVAPGTGFAGG
jgi:hypothetical protein